MKDKEQGRKGYIKKLYDEKIMNDIKIKELLKRSAEIEIFLYWFADEDYINYLDKITHESVKED